jgi:O-methyltransferase
MPPAQEPPAAEVRALYLELMKRSLTGALAEDSDLILNRADSTSSLPHRAAHAVGRLTARFGFELSRKRPYDPRLRERGMDYPSRAESMIGLMRMENIRQCIEQIVRDDVPGDLIETGVWRGGACIFMKANLVAWGDTTRNVWLADSFEGLPKGNGELYPADDGDTMHGLGYIATAPDQVRHNFERYGLLDDRVRFLVGWFKDTLPTAPIERLSLLRLDGDMYESTIQAFDALYDKLSPGGFCIVDDYGSHASQAGQATRDFRARREIDEELIDIDGFGAYWRKA